MKPAALFSSLLAFLFALSPAQGGLLLHEDFNYFGAQLDEANGGLGWRTSWQSTPQLNANSIAALGLESLPGPGNYPTGSGKSLVLTHPGGQTTAYRGFNTDAFVDFSKDGTYFLSFLAQRSSSGYGISLLSGASNPVLSLSVSTGGAVTMNLAGESVTSGTLIANNASYLFVAKIVTSAAGPDQVFFQSYTDSQALPMAEPEAWLLGASAESTLLAERMALLGGSNRTIAFDEIRMGTTWDAIAIPEPATMAVGASLFALFATLIRRRANCI